MPAGEKTRPSGPRSALVLQQFEVFLVVDVFAFVVVIFFVDDLKRGHFAVRFIERVVVDFKGIGDSKEGRFYRGIPVSPPRCGGGQVLFQGRGQGLKRDTRIDAHDFTLARKRRKWRAMKEHFLSSSVRRERDYARQYEYLVLTVSPEDSLPEARRLLAAHSEYGKWELERSVLYIGGGRRFWLRRKVIQVQRTV
jgi:Family of unknown function (DUF5703)